MPKAGSPRPATGAPASAQPEPTPLMDPPAATGAPVPSQPPDDLADKMNRLMSQAAAPPTGPATDRQAEDQVLSTLRGLNLKDIPSNGFRVLPLDREYEAELKKVEVTRAKNSGNQMISLEMDVIFPEEYQGVRLWDQCVLTDNSLWKLKSLLEACGMLDEEGEFSGSSLQDLVGYAVRFSVRHDQYQGATRNKIAGGYTPAYEHPDLHQAQASPEVTGQPAGVNWDS